MKIIFKTNLLIWFSHFKAEFLVVPYVHHDMEVGARLINCAKKK
jgi:hypothetical protein